MLTMFIGYLNKTQCVFIIKAVFYIAVRIRVRSKDSKIHE